jgi:HEAT repeat protein
MNFKRWTLWILPIAAALVPALPPAACAPAPQDYLAQEREKEKGRRPRADEGREERAYERGKKALDENRWDQALAAFDGVVQMGGSRADGALYWKAYALNKQGQRSEALAALGELQKSFPNSRWLKEAKALDVEVRQAAGQPVAPEKEPDEELKLIAINGLLNSDPERAVPLLEKFLAGNQSPRLKERALFVLTQSGSSRAREVVAQIAKGTSNPDLQIKAINYLGVFGGKANGKFLADVYASSSDAAVKRTVLHSFMVSGDRERLLAAAKSETAPELRGEAIHQLGVLGAQNELWELYQAESEVTVKEKLLHAMFVGGNVDRLAEVARSEKDPKLRAAAIHSLGISGGRRTGETLSSLYESDKDPSIRRQIIQALFVQSNARALVDLAKKETDPALKKEIVSKLSLMRSKDAIEYLMEILNK